MPEDPQPGQGQAQASAPAAASADDGFSLVIMLEEGEDGEERTAPRARRVRPEPTTTMDVVVPQELAQELKQALAVLPGLSLDELAAEALARVLAEHGAPRLASRRRAADTLVVLV